MADEPPTNAPPEGEFASVSGDAPPDAPETGALSDAFLVYDVREEDGDVVYYGDPLVPRREALRTLYPLFREAGYDVTFEEKTGELAIVARPRDTGPDGVPWLNVFLFVATVATTTLSGALWYYVFQRHDLAANPLGILDALPFVVAVLGVLGTHELGHYLMSRYHGVDASLPYFIPMLPPFGTWGAVIKMRGHFPDREALFDVGVAGPLAGLVAAVVVTAVGLTLPPVAVPDVVQNSPNAITINFGFPPLFYAVAWAVGEPLSYPDGMAPNPVVMGGWIGMLVTLLNLLPAGQLDGGHVLRAILGPTQARVAKLVPLLPLGAAGYVYFVAGGSDSLGIWVLWALVASFMVFVGSVTPIDDEPLDRKRVAVGLFTFALGALCFTPVPIAVSG